MVTGEGARYLERIGVGPVAGPLDGAELARLHLAHLRAVPFENLAIHLGEPVSLVEADLLAKVVDRRRGGFCYELNGAFATLLRWLGADVRYLSARAHSGEGRFGPPFDHLALAVRTADGSGPWLADVGFGEHSWYPLRLDVRGPQADPSGVFEVVDAEDGDVVVLRDGIPQYRLETRQRALADFGPTCWYHRTSPESHFTRSLVCSLATPQGRVSLSGRRLIRTAGGSRTEEDLPDDAAVLAAYRDHFGLELDRVPALRPA